MILVVVETFRSETKVVAVLFGVFSTVVGYALFRKLVRDKPLSEDDGNWLFLAVFGSPGGATGNNGVHEAVWGPDGDRGV